MYCASKVSLDEEHLPTTKRIMINNELSMTWTAFPNLVPSQIQSFPYHTIIHIPSM